MARLVVVVKEQSQAGLVHLVTLAERERLSRKASQSLPQRVVELLDVIGLAFLFTDGPVVPIRNHRFVSVPKVRVGTSCAVTFGQATPEDAAGCLASVADGESDDLTSSAA